MVGRLKLLTYRQGDSLRPGLLMSDRVYDFEDMGGLPYSSVLDVLNDWPNSERVLRRAVANEPRGSGRPPTELCLAPPVLYPGNIYAAGANYHDHVAEMRAVMGTPDELYGHELGLPPWHFIKASKSCVVGPDEMIVIPPAVTQLDWEAELAVVVGRMARRVRAEEALQYVAGYTIANDLSARDLTRRPKLVDTAPMKYDWIGQKCFDGACPMGPWLTLSSDITDPQNLSIHLWVNDELKQESNTSRMIYSIAEQIATLSERLTLHPGDVILTGSPAGVGLARGEFLHPGDTVRIAIQSLGELTNVIVKENQHAASASFPLSAST